MQRAQDWLTEAHAELLAARDLLRGSHWSWCCFTSHQSAEKALKAICDHLRIPQSGHNLSVLLGTIQAERTVADPLRAACARLNRHDIPTRFPDAFDRGAPVDQFVSTDADDAVRDAEAVVQFAQQVLGER